MTGLPFSWPLEGTAGAALTAGNVGCDSVSGTGTAVYVNGGLAPGSSKRALFTNQRVIRAEGVTGDTAWVTLYLRADSGRPTVDDAIFMRHFDSGGANLSGLQLNKVTGRIQLLAGEAPDGSDVETDGAYADTNLWLIRHHDDRILGRQWAFIYNDNGKLHAELTADVRAGSYDRTEVGITNVGTTWQVSLDQVAGDENPLYMEPFLDRFRVGGFTQNSVQVWVQAQGGPYARLTTFGPSTFVVSDPVALDWWGAGKFVVDALPVPASTYSHTLEVQTLAGAWVPVTASYPINTRTAEA